MRGVIGEDDFLDRKREVDAELQAVAARLGDLQSRLDALDPSADAYARLARALGRGDGTQLTQPVDAAFVVPPDAQVDVTGWPTEKTSGMAPEEWHQLLRRIIRRVVVNERTIVIEPWVGEPTTYDRAVVMPPRKRTDTQVRDGAGRFVKTTA
jgi:hypothetical protein